MEQEQEMRVTKRDGKLEDVSFDKILKRVKKLGVIQGATPPCPRPQAELPPHLPRPQAELPPMGGPGARATDGVPPLVVNYSQLVMKVIDQLYDKISTTDIDELTAEQCAALSTKHLDYATLANRIVVSNNHKNTLASFSDSMELLYNFTDVHGLHKPLIDPTLWQFINANRTTIDGMIDYSRDYLFDYFGFKTLERAYLMRVHNKVIERPQHMWMRVALGIHQGDLTNVNLLTTVKETYDLMSNKYFTHATPTLFNAGTPRPQLSSCYLISMESDSIDGIYNTLKDCAKISKWAGGIGLHIHNIRATGSHIDGTNGTSNGIVPMLRNFNTTARYVDQGGGKRNGSFAIYLEPWHADVEAFLELKKNHGDEEMRARDLFYALWIPDLFMERVKVDGEWALFCPHKCPGLADCFGEEFRQLYTKYVNEGKANKIIKARELWYKILDSQMETGTPYLLYKDAANRKSNQQNLGTIKSSNLCVAPETHVLTDKGYFEIKSLEGKTINVWNGEEFSETVVTKTGINQPLITIETSDGCSLNCTPYHKFFIQKDEKVESVEACQLKIDDQLIKCSFPIINGSEVYPPYMINRVVVPVNASIINKINWLSNYFDYYTSSSIIISGTLHLSNADKNVVIQMKYMLQTCGINPKLRCSTNLSSLIISSVDLHRLIELGFKSNRLNVNLVKTIEVDSRPDITIKNILNSSRTDDTYCFSESKRHAGIFNGMITSQCTEIMEFSDHNETAVCNLASIGLAMFVSTADACSTDVNAEAYKSFDYAKLHAVTKVVTRNLNKVIDINYYPTEKTRLSNLLHRPIGIGVQGLADMFALMDIPFHSDDARRMNKLVFETIYHAALECSNEIAIERQRALNDVWVPGAQLFTDKNDPICNTYYPVSAEFQSVLRDHKPILAELKNLKRTHAGAYSSFSDSPASWGELQFDMWGVDPGNGFYNWTALKESIIAYGLRNSLLVAPMPTASTSQILGNNECFEPFTSNIYSRRTNAGEFVIVNKYLMKELMELGLWNEELKDNIIVNKGSIQHIDFIPKHIRDKYKIVWEIPMKHVIDMAADRGAYICQSQSLNLWMEDPDYKALTSMHFYAWQAGLKTGMYYLRRKAKHQAQQFTIAPTNVANGVSNANNSEKILEDEPCEMCSG